nr:MAG TPA: hypothetical protein [Bacteriophage sp.]
MIQFDVRLNISFPGALYTTPLLSLLNNILPS